MKAKNNSKSKKKFKEAQKQYEEKGYVKLPNGQCFYELKTTYGKVIYMFNSKRMESLFAGLALDFLAKLEGTPTTIRDIKEKHGIPEEQFIDVTLDLSEEIVKEFDEAAKSAMTYFMDNLAQLFMETFERVVGETFCLSIMDRAGKGYFTLNATQSKVFDNFLKVNYGYPQVDLYIDGDYFTGSYLGSANLMVNNPGCYPNSSGFSFSIPSYYQDGQTHTVHAYVYDQDSVYNPGTWNQWMEVMNSPQTFQLGSGSSGPGGINSNWNDNNYNTSDDPGVQPGDPPNTGTNGAGSGNFSFSAPVLNLTGRGMGVNLALNYNSLLWHKAGTDISYDIDKGSPAPGWNIGFGKMMDMGGTGGAMLEDLDGTRHSYDGTTSSYGGYSTYYGKTTDGSFIDYAASRTPSGLSGGVARFSSGTTINYGAAANGVAYPTSIKDRHGNYMTIAYQNNQGPNISTITDNLGRVITFNYDTLNRLVSITGPGQNNTARVLVRLHYTQQTLNYSFTGLTPQVRAANPYQIDAIYYPEIGTGYWFGDSDSYSSYGMIAKVSERRGMVWNGANDNDQGTITVGTMTREMVYNYPLTAASLTEAPQYTTMTETWAGMTTAPAVTTYSVNSSATPRTTTVTFPNGNKIKQSSFNNPNQWNDGLTYQIETLSPTNQVLSKSVTAWEPGDYNTSRITEIQSFDELNQMTKQTFTYDSYYNQVASVSEYGYSNNLLRKKISTYENGANYRGGYTSINGQNVWSGGRHIFSLLKSEELQDAGNARLSRIEYTYDQGQLINTPNVVMYDQTYNPYTTDTYQGSCISGQFNHWRCSYEGESVYDPDYGWIDYCYYISCNQYEEIQNFDSSTLARGNLTETKTYTDAANLQGIIAYASTYDIAGNLRTTTTDCCQQMAFNYSTATQYSQPDNQTKGSPNDPNLQVTASAIYDFNTGLIKSSLDFNNLQTQYFYDAVNRPVQTLLPTGAKSVTAYDDANMKVLQTGLESNNNVVSQGESVFNGRGQAILSRSLAGSQWNAAQIKYDQMGRKIEASMPYAEPGNPSQWTTYQYDLLSRVVQVTAPDGSTSKTFYNESARPGSASNSAGSTVRSQDAWGRERWARTDDFGRLAEVVEPDPNGNGSVGASGSLVTNYAYNPKDELVQINQGTQVRAFKYDSLGRLTRQKLAEQAATIEGLWSDAFVYDNRSNLVERTDARGVKTIFNYNSDPLNRLQSIGYNKTNAINPNTIADAETVTIGYETASNKDKTRVVSIVTGNVNAPTTLETNDYDAYGRVQFYKMTMFGKPQMTTEYAYDTANRLTAVTYPNAVNTPLAAKTINPGYDNASRMTQVAVNGQLQLSDIVYNPMSQVTQLKTGAATGNADIEQYAYDGQTGLLINQKVIKQNTNQTLLDLSYDYQRGDSSGTLNGKTGQLTRIVNNLDDGKNRRYAFDALGRLATIYGGRWTEKGDVYTTQIKSKWTQSYTYDRYGNRTNVAATGDTVTNGVAAPAPADGIGALNYDQSSNRIINTNYEYDAAGNLTRGQAANGTFQRFDYDAAGKLVQVKDDNGNPIESYSYGASRQRLRTQNAALTTYYAWGGSSVLCEYAETTGNAATYKFSKSYIYAGSRLLSTQMWNGASETEEFHHPDRLGTKLVTNNQANTFYEQSTLPFGTSLDAENTGVPTTNQRFTSYDRSGTTSLDYAVNRNYSSGQGRFTSVDPIGMASTSIINPQSLNLYAYVQNNPIDFVDPSGLICYGFHVTEYLIYFNEKGEIERIEENYLGFITTFCTNDGNTGGSGGGGGGGGTDIPPRSGPCNLKTPNFDELAKANPAAYKLLNDTYGDRARIEYASMTIYNQAVFLNTIGAVAAQGIDLSSAKFVDFYRGGSANANAFGVYLSGISTTSLDKSGLSERSIDLFGVPTDIEGVDKSRRSPSSIKEGSVEATQEGDLFAFDVDLFNPNGNLIRHTEEVLYNKRNNATTHPADVVRKLNSRGVQTGVKCE